jgi:hypothetical protein
MSHTLPELGYAYDALEPFIDKETMNIHHTKHHQAYINNLVNAIKGKADLEKKSAIELISNLNAVPEDIRMAVRNNGGGHVNHSFFWPLLKKMSPSPARRPTRSQRRSAASSSSRSSSPRPQSEGSAPAGPGWRSATASWKSPARPTRTRRSPMAKRRCLVWMAGNTPTI